MDQKEVAIFDLSITLDSPAGSCILQLLKGLCDSFHFTVFADRFENPSPQQITWIRVPLPQKPVLSRYVLFQGLAPLYYRNYLRGRRTPDIIISTEGEFPQCDICYAHFCHKAYLQQHKIKANLPKKLARLATHKFNKKLEEKAFKQAKKIIVPSQGLLTEIVNTYDLALKDKLVSIPNPVDVERFTRPAAFDALKVRGSLKIKPDEIVAVFMALGDFHRKGLGLLLEALASVGNPKLKLLVVGGNQHEIQEYGAISHQMRLDNRVLFTGFQADVRSYLWASDLFVFPSSYETFSLATFQAAVAGLPAIATQLYGVEDFLQPGVNGWLIERSVSSIVKALKVATGDRDKLAAMGASAHQTAAQYGQSVFVERWRSVLAAL